MKHRYIKQKIKGTLIFLMAVSLSACGVKEEKNRQQAEENSAEESISKDVSCMYSLSQQDTSRDNRLNMLVESRVRREVQARFEGDFRDMAFLEGTSRWVPSVCPRCPCR